MRLRVPAVPPGAGWVAASGLILGLAHPPLHLLLPSFLGLVPFGIWLGRLPEGEEGRRAAFRGGFWLGVVYYTLLLHWLVTSLVHYSLMALPGFVFIVVPMCLFLAVATVGVYHVRWRLGWPLWIALPVFWTAAEWFRAHLGPISFPWNEFGYTLTGFPRLIGVADIVGARGLSFWLVMLNGLLATGILAWRAGRRRGVWLALGGWGLALALPVAYSLHRWTSLDPEVAATVTIVQPNISEDLKLDRHAAIDSTRRAIESLLAGHDPGRPIDLLVLPETVIPLPVDPIPATGYRGLRRVKSWLANLAYDRRAPVLFGTIGIDKLPRGEWDYFNSALLVDVTGERLGRYDKHHLVPIVERVPFLNPDWFTWVPYLDFGGFGVGVGTAPMEADGARFGVLICYESIFADLSREFRRRGANYLVNITNDAWFGSEEPSWSRSSALWQHPSHLVLRAIENRIGIVRAANTGISEIVDPLGRVHEATELFTSAIFTADVLTTRGLTPFARAGDVVGWLAALAAAVGAVLPAILGGAARAAGPPPEGNRAP